MGYPMQGDPLFEPLEVIWGGAGFYVLRLNLILWRVKVTELK